LVEALTWLTATRLVLLASPRRLTAGLLRRAAKTEAVTQAIDRDQAQQVASDVERAAQLVSSTCLSRALSGWLMLRRRGVSSVVRVGARQVRAAAPRLHAWLEVGGLPLIGREEAGDFVALTRG
jgi:hypothetical protein